MQILRLLTAAEWFGILFVWCIWIITVCDPGRFGQFCNHSCPGQENCLDRVCDRYTGECDACVSSRWDTICNGTCPQCVDGFCNQGDGVCEVGCNDGFYGPTCNNQCGSRCDRCDRDTGDCLICSIGTFGEVCEFECSSNCLPDGATDLVTCSKDDGNCTSGACVPGYYDPTCTFQCSLNCAVDANGDSRCDVNSGKCIFGCEIGYFGPRCLGTCSDTCQASSCFGDRNNCTIACIDTYYDFPICDKTCNNNCIEDTCLDDSGICTYGCEVGYFGDMCDERCLQENTCVGGACDRMLGYCAECDKPKPNYLCREAGKTRGLFKFYHFIHLLPFRSIISTLTNLIFLTYVCNMFFSSNSKTYNS